MPTTPQKRTAPARTFTLDEANATLPLVRLVAEDIVETHHELVELKSKYAAQREKDSPSQDELPPVDSDLYKMDETLMVKMLKMQSFVREIEEIGGTVGRLEEGEVDFPSILEGRKVYLCWKLGESRISYWHDLEDSTTRKPLPAAPVA